MARGLLYSPFLAVWPRERRSVSPYSRSRTPEYMPGPFLVRRVLPSLRLIFRLATIHITLRTSLSLEVLRIRPYVARLSALALHFCDESRRNAKTFALQQTPSCLFVAFSSPPAFPEGSGVSAFPTCPSLRSFVLNFSSATVTSIGPRTVSKLQDAKRYDTRAKPKRVALIGE